MIQQKTAPTARWAKTTDIDATVLEAVLKYIDDIKNPKTIQHEK